MFFIIIITKTEIFFIRIQIIYHYKIVNTQISTNLKTEKKFSKKIYISEHFNIPLITLYVSNNY